MSFKDIKAKNQGFTIVELLIVVVVIAILAAITIVSYNGITNRANGSAAKSMAASVQKKAELYFSDDSTSGYPATVAAMGVAADSGKAYYITLNSIKEQLTTLNSTTGKTSVQYVRCGTGSATTAPTTQATITTTTGAVVNYYDFENNRSTQVTTASPSATATNPAGIILGQVTGLVGTNNIGCPTS